MADLRRWLALLLELSGMPHAELSIVFTGDRAMRALNRSYRGIDRTTDVLSFSQCEGEVLGVPLDMLGDIVISVPRAERQAAEYQCTLIAEIQRLLVHGLLHLLGYDHERGGAEAARMRRREAYLLGKVAL